MWLVAEIEIFIAFMAVLLAWAVIRYMMSSTKSMRLKNLSSRRRLGKFEEDFLLMSDKRKGTSNTCFVLVLRSMQSLVESSVRHSLLRVAMSQPMLRAVFRNVSKSFFFGEESFFDIIQPDNVGDMVQLIKFDVSASKWSKLWHEIAVQDFKTELLWQAVLFREEYLVEENIFQNTIVFQVKHCIMDGVSGIKMCKQFLSELNSYDVWKKSPRTLTSSPLEVLPSFYHLLKDQYKSPSLWRYMKSSLPPLQDLIKFTERLKLRIMLSQLPKKPYDFIETHTSFETRELVFKVFSPEQTNALRKVCRSKGVTVTAALMTAVHMAFCKLIENQSSNFPAGKNLSQLLAINGRRACHLRPPEDYLSNMVLVRLFCIPCDNEDFWSKAVKIKKRIDDVLSTDEFVHDELEQHDIWHPRERVEELLSPLNSKTRIQISKENFMSSAGAFDFEDDEKSSYRLHESLFYSIPYGYSIFVSHYNSTINGKMSWVIMCNNFVPPAMEKEFTELCFAILMNETIF